MKHDVRSAEEVRFRTGVLLLPQLEAFGQFELPFRDLTAFTPGSNLFGLEGDKDALAPVFDGGNPPDLIRQRSAIHANLQLTINVIRGRLETREADQRNHFAQT